MKNTFRLPLLCFLLLGGVCFNFCSAQNWSVKTDALGSFHDAFSLEVERSLNSRISVVAQLGLSDPTIRKNVEFVDGLFFKVGPKFYIKQGNGMQSGFFVKPVFVYDWWRNRGRESDPIIENFREYSYGGLLELGYAFQLGSKVRMEPWLGIGYFQHIARNDGARGQFPGIDVIVRGVLHKDEVRAPGYSHRLIFESDNLSLSYGFQISYLF